MDSAGNGPTITTTETQKKANLSARSRAVTVARQLCPSSGGSDASSRHPVWRIGDPWSTRSRHVSYDLEGGSRGYTVIVSTATQSFFFFPFRKKGDHVTWTRWVQKRLLPIVEQAFRTGPVGVHQSPTSGVVAVGRCGLRQIISRAVQLRPAGGVTYATFFIF